MGISQNLDRLFALHRSRLRSHGETEFFRQQIVDRHLRLHGSHYFSCFGRLGQALAPDDRRAILCAELLERIRLIPAAARRLALRGGRPWPLRCVVTIDESLLLEHSLMDDMAWTAAELKPFGLQLVLELSGRLEASGLAAAPRASRVIFGHLYGLLDHGVELMARLAAQQGSLSARVLALGLCRYVKVDLRQCCVEAAAGQDEVLDRTHGAMTALLERYDVCFMADRIERHADHQLALRLPFHLLSGDYYSPPEPI